MDFKRRHQLPKLLDFSFVGFFIAKRSDTTINGYCIVQKSLLLLIAICYINQLEPANQIAHSAVFAKLFLHGIAEALQIHRAVY